MKYLNNSGSRWVTENMGFVLVYPGGEKRVRQADAYESFGNFAVTLFRHGGRRYAGLPKAHDGSETRDPEAQGILALPHIWLAKARLCRKEPADGQQP